MLCFKLDADALLHKIKVFGNIGTMPEYQLLGDWPIYQDRLEQYFAANMIESDRRVAVLLTSIGDQTYKILRDVCDPDPPSSKSYEQLITILRNQFSPRTSVFRSRILFYSLMQSPEEKINDWYIRIKNNAISCKFGHALDSIVKDKFVSGLLRGPILDKLCEENHEKTTNELKEIALIKEANMEPIEEDINRRASGDKRKYNKKYMSTGLCFSCGKSNHGFYINVIIELNCNNCIVLFKTVITRLKIKIA